jgi:hypothetical protein
MLGNNKKSIGFNNSLYNNKGGLSAAALLWKTNIIANGGTIPDATLQIFDTNFFIPATANGNILNELDRLNIYCGLNGFEIAARTNIISSSFFVSPVSSPTFDNNGYKSSGTSYLNLNYNPNTQGVKLTQNSITQFIAFKNPVLTGATRRSMGLLTGGGTIRLELYINDGGNRSAFNSQAAVLSTSTGGTGYVHFLGRRTAASGANCSEIIINGTSTFGSNISVTLPNGNILELTSSNAGTPIGDYDTNYHLASGHGSKNLDNTALRTILNNLFTALGV